MSPLLDESEVYQFWDTSRLGLSTVFCFPGSSGRSPHLQSTPASLGLAYEVGENITWCLLPEYRPSSTGSSSNRNAQGGSVGEWLWHLLLSPHLQEEEGLPFGTSPFCTGSATGTQIQGTRTLPQGSQVYSNQHLEHVTLCHD